MQITSNEYVESMKKPLRNRAYIKANIGVINSEAQENINFDNNRLTYYSNIVGVVNDLPVNNLYATAEENFTAVDGSMYFLPDEGEVEYYNNGIVTEDIKGTITINFGEKYNLEFKGLTINFGKCYPTRFRIVTDQKTEEYENNNELFITGDTYEHVSYVRIEPIEMLGGQDRLRLVSFLCGVTTQFTNEEVINASITDYASPVAESVPSMDMSLTIENFKQYYCPDDDDSLYAALEQGQQMTLQFGYDVKDDGNIEWLKPYIGYLSSWSATDTTATFNAVDLFEYRLKDNYIKGDYYVGGRSLYDLAVDVFTDAGFVNGEYHIDSYLKKVIVKNPIPAVTQAEALQIIANAGRAVLKISRNDVISIETSFTPEVSVSVNNKTDYSRIDKLLKKTDKIFYAESSKDYSTTNETVSFFPNDDNYAENTGYVSESMYLGNGEWDGEAPKITITFDTSWEFYGLAINFVSLAPQLFNITTYLENEEVDNWDFEEPELNFYTFNTFRECDKVEITIIEGNPNARVFIDSILVASVTDYRLTRDLDIIESPDAERLNKIESITVICSDYFKTTDTQSAEITFEVPSGTSSHTVTFNTPGYNFNATLDEDAIGTVTITESGSYYVKIEIDSPVYQEVKVKLEAKCYDVASKPYKQIYNQKGDIVVWKNPLISDMEYAAKLEKWLSEYYLGNIDYTVQWRGDPRVEADDLFIMELKDREDKVRDDVYIRAYQSKLDFNGGWKGELRARKAVLTWQ